MKLLSWIITSLMWVRDTIDRSDRWTAIDQIRYETDYEEWRGKLPYDARHSISKHISQYTDKIEQLEEKIENLEDQIRQQTQYSASLENDLANARVKAEEIEVQNEMDQI